MKKRINMRIFKYIKTKIIFTLIFCLLFPYSLFAEVTNKYKIPQNSLSYFLQNQKQGKYLETTTTSSGAVIPPLTPLDTQVTYHYTANTARKNLVQTGYKTNKKVLSPKTDNPEEIYNSTNKSFIKNKIIEPKIQTKNVIKTKKSIINRKADIFSPLTFKDSEPQKIDVVATNTTTANKSFVARIRKLKQKLKTFINKTKNSKTMYTKHKIIVKSLKKHKALQNKNIKPSPKATTTIVSNKTKHTYFNIKIKHSSSSVLFAKALAKMEKGKAEREAEAQKLGIILPSQSHDIASVSPSLNQLHNLLQKIINNAEQRA